MIVPFSMCQRRITWAGDTSCASAIRAIVRDLPEKLRIPVELYYLGDCTVEQIARTIQRPRGTVKSRLFQAREVIRKRLEEAGYEV